MNFRPAEEARRARRWLTPGMGVKRWFVLFGLCTLVGAVGFLHFTWTGPLHIIATRWILWLNNFTNPSFAPLWVVGIVVMALALIGAITAMTMLNRSLLRATGTDPRSAVDVIYSRKTLSRGPHVVAVGGGTGLSNLLTGLKEHSSNLSAIVTVADDGGSSGRLRESLDMIAPGDLTDCYAALSDSPVLARLLLHRFARGEGLQGHTFGNLMLATLSEERGGLATALQDLHEVLKVRGAVYPATTTPATLVAHTAAGAVVRGESHLAQRPGAGTPEGRITEVHLEPRNLPTLQAVTQAISEAELIVLGPGSLFTSIIPALLVPGIQSAIRASSAPLVYVASVMTEPGETDNFTLDDHIYMIEGHLGRMPDIILVNSSPVSGRVQQKYLQEGARLITPSSQSAELRLRLRRKSLLSSGKAHHDPTKLARALLEQIEPHQARWREEGQVPSAKAR